MQFGSVQCVELKHAITALKKQGNLVAGFWELVRVSDAQNVIRRWKR